MDATKYRLKHKKTETTKYRLKHNKQYKQSTVWNIKEKQQSTARNITNDNNKVPSEI